MKTESRRAEKRQTIVSEYQKVYSREMNFSQWEHSDFPQFLESTGVLIMDRIRKIAYVSLSERCSEKIAHVWASRMGYELCMFKSTDSVGRPIYHTNVVMSVGTTMAVVCLDSVDNQVERENLEKTLQKTHLIVKITREQMNNFCGNCLELRGHNGKKFLCMSQTAYNHFTDEQKKVILQHVDDFLYSDINVIETIGGGSVRCMMGELF